MDNDFYMLEQFEQNDEQNKGSSLFVPLLGSPKSDEPPLLVAKARRISDGKLYDFQIYEDRLVGLSGPSKILLCLEGDIFFRASLSDHRISLRSDQSEKLESLEFDSEKEIKQFIVELGRVCPQTGFFQKYKLLEELGRGKESQVFKAIRLEDQQIFACKRQKNSRYFSREMRTLHQLEHPNLIYLREFFIENDQIAYTIMDFEDGGSLLDILHSQEDLSLRRKIQIISDLLNAMEFLRLKGIVHRDIKPENILYSEKEDKYKIADFGFARRAGEKFDKIVGTPGYIAPEVLQDSSQQITIASDIYSMGLVFFQILTGVQYYQGRSAEELLSNNLKTKSIKKRSTQFDLRSFERELLDKMIRSCPDHRKDSYQILSSSTFKKLNRAHQAECRDSGSTKSKDSDDEESLMGTVKKLFNIRSSS